MTKRHTKNKKSKRTKSREYYSDDLQVRIEMFLNSLQINGNHVWVALYQLRSNNIICDKRGLNSGGRNAIDDKRIQEINQHISSFPRYIIYIRSCLTSQ
ncbi:unnamed protein product [Acanthoscelides obtectus]|uniref:Uncharacterized protein n=1 Tax=Acanthoscelides obtectus TaxID=200917 RepID=A0A9P0PZX2_ACAOB|nr:unnamed protein product [Acanthoscelides obtectus]CAK1655557.1 hypothetical protein AOBTE_LOCUS19216 [Acanthoscelides obtectus]